MRIKRIIPLLALLATQAANGFAPTNLLSPSDWAMRFPKNQHHKRFSLGLGSVEAGGQSRGRSWDDKDVSILAIHDINQNALAMVLKPVATADPVATLAAENMLYTMLAAQVVGGDIFDNGIRGRQVLTGDFNQWDVTMFAAYDFWCGSWGHWSLSVHVPVVHKQVHEIGIVDQTAKAGDLAYNNVVDAGVTHVVLSTLASTAKTLGNLDLGDWDETGIGDVEAFLNWKHCFKMCSHEHRSVDVHAKIGVLFPTAEEKDADKAFSMPLGNDGAWGMPMGLGLTCNANKWFRLGVDGELKVLFDKTSVRRLKTNVAQTEFLLLNKGSATKEHGLTWEAHAWAQAYHVMYGLSVGAAYQYVGHEHDELEVKTAGFVNAVVNTAHSLKDWNVHNVIFRANYDFFQKNEKACCVPQIGLFYKWAVDGKNVIDTDTYGGQFSLSF